MFSILEVFLIKVAGDKVPIFLDPKLSQQCGSDDHLS